jgi:hypothetical protein
LFEKADRSERGNDAHEKGPAEPVGPRLIFSLRCSARAKATGPKGTVGIQRSGARGRHDRSMNHTSGFGKMKDGRAAGAIMTIA